MNLVVIGAQWGDEGKGKIVDFLADRADVIVRFSGGANAGHTIVRGDSVYKLHLVPSGIVYEDTRVVLGTGMVIDPEALFAELDGLSRDGIEWRGRVFISDRAHLVLPRYKKQDIDLDRKRKSPIGTTGRGIGVAYSTKAARDGVRLVDIFEDTVVSELEPEDRAFVEKYQPRLEEMLVDIHSYMEWVHDKNILLEGAQGALLDLDLGTYPYVSSGCSGAAGAALGGGLGPKQLDRIVGVFKAYTTRVGNGPFPTEFRRERDGDLEDTIRELGHEYGVTTGRPRRCGYLDLIALRYACQANSIESLALTHLDVYDSFDEIRMCVAYEIDDAVLDYFPASRSVLEDVQPVIKKFPGWKSDISGTTSYDALPREAKDYVRFIEQFTGTSVDIVSVGSDQKQTIVRRDPWTKS